ncbi:MAG: endonuclease V [Candidatus Bathyarchaeia archaeon]
MNLQTRPPRFPISKAHKAQLQLSKKIIAEDRLPSEMRFVAGVDVAYAGSMSIGAVVVLEFGSFKLVEAQTAVCKTRFPYIPTLLSFRELPPVVASIKKLQTQPDIFLVDGQGLAHPYRCGFASHLGLVLNKPTIGVAKNRLFGTVEPPGVNSNIAFLKHEGKVVGASVVTKRGCKPLWVSVGHMVSLETAIKLVMDCVQNHRVPEPLLKAHEAATREKRKIHIP